MYIIFVYLIFDLVLKIHTISIPKIRDVFLQPVGFTQLNIIIRSNTTCKQCLCEHLSNGDSTNYLALNCLTAGTCQFFTTFPLSYKLKSSIGAQLYFLQNIYPNASICCVPNITQLIGRLQSVIPAMINLTFQPGALGYDENVPNEAVVIGYTVGILSWFDLFSLTITQNRSIWTTLSVALYNGSLFTSQNLVPTIYVLDNKANNQITNITHSSLTQTRKHIFINNGQRMIITAQTVNSLAIFDVNSPTNYKFQQFIPVPFPAVHGLAKVNDTFFYASTWTNRHIVKYEYENATWNYQTFINATGSGSGSHLTVDECGRIWYIVNPFGLRIYDSSGVEVANWNMSLGLDSIYDILLLPNYVLFMTQKNAQLIIRYDPQLLC